MFGTFSIEAGENRLSCLQNRSKKTWILLAYLICQKGRTTSKKELIQLLWGETPSLADPENTLKITFHRLRLLLNQLWPGAGHELILFQENGYTWNTSIPVDIDIEQFDRLYSCNCETEDLRIQNLQKILSLYTGDFLADFSTENWVTPIAAKYHTQYINVILEIIPFLTHHHDHKQIVHLCQKASKLEPYHEMLHLHFMKSLVKLNDKAGALEIYKQLSRDLFHDFGLRPGKEIREYYRYIANSLNTNTLSLHHILNTLAEPVSPGALQCDYEQFIVLCHAQGRILNQNGYTAHIALISVTGRLDSKPLSLPSVRKSMTSLADAIHLNLSPNHIFAQCSSCQYVILFPYDDYENSTALCRKIIAEASHLLLY